MFLFVRSFSHFLLARHRNHVGPDPYRKGSITGNETKTPRLFELFFWMFLFQFQFFTLNLKIATRQKVGGSTVTWQIYSKLTNMQGDKGVLN